MVVVLLLLLLLVLLLGGGVGRILCETLPLSLFQYLSYVNTRCLNVDGTCSIPCGCRQDGKVLNDCEQPMRTRFSRLVGAWGEDISADPIEGRKYFISYPGWYVESEVVCNRIVPRYRHVRSARSWHGRRRPESCR